MKVLMNAYACEPGRGSEGGVGWNWAVASARRHEVWVLTRANNRSPIEAGLAKLDPEIRERLHFEYVDLPDAARFWKRGGLGIRVYYYVWQVLARQRALALRRNEGFDVVHHTTLANVWLPSLVVFPNTPFVLGPVSGGQRVPVQLYPTLGGRATALELLLLLARLLSRLNPLVRAGWRRASVIVVNNLETIETIPRGYRERVVIRSNAVVEMPLTALSPGEGNGSVSTASGTPRFVAACVGRLSPFKGVALAVEGLAYAPAWELLIIGDGSERRSLERLARQRGVSDRVTFVPSLGQEELWQTMRTCRALVLPTLKEGASFVAAEAQALGVPVVALARGGPAVLGLFPETSFHFVEVGRREQTVRRIAAALEAIAHAPRPGATRAFGVEGIVRDADVLYELARAPRREWPKVLMATETDVMLPAEAGGR
jgi:glycosyltransferase involved in cell wall biosynthesis